MTEKPFTLFEEQIEVTFCIPLSWRLCRFAWFQTFSIPMICFFSAKIFRNDLSSYGGILIHQEHHKIENGLYKQYCRVECDL